MNTETSIIKGKLCTPKTEINLKNTEICIIVSDVNFKSPSHNNNIEPSVPNRSVLIDRNINHIQQNILNKTI